MLSGRKVTTKEHTSPLLETTVVTKKDVTEQELLDDTSDASHQADTFHKTNTFKLYFEIDELIKLKSKQFAEFYPDKNKWDSEESIEFLKEIIKELRNALVDAQEKQKELKGKNTCTESIASDPDSPYRIISYKYLPSAELKAMAKKEEFIEEVIQSLPKIIKQYEDTLSERQITLEQKNPSLPTINAQINDNQNKPHREDETRLYRAAANSFPLLLQILKEPTLASQLSIQELIDLVKVNHDKGVDTNNLPNIDSITLSGVVTLEIYKRICGEVERRLNGKTINNYDEIKTFVVFSCQEQSQVLAHELGTNSYYQCHEKVAKNLTKTFSEKLEQPLYNAFVNIYQALYDGQSGPFKRNFLTRLDSSQSLEERIALIKALSEKDPNSRVATAWKLAQKHYLNCTPSNAKLFTKIHKEAFKRSWVFKRTKIVKDIVFFSSSNLNKKPDFTVEQINAGQKDPSSRRAKIANALLGR